MSKLLRKTGIKTREADNTAGDKFLKEEREMWTRDGEKEPGFPSSVVPTLEEKIIMEHRPHQTSPIEEAPEDQEESRTPNGDEHLQNGDVHPSNDDNPKDGDVTKERQENATTAGDGDTIHAPAVQNGSADTNVHEDVAQAGAADRTPPQAALETGELYGAPADASVDPRHDNEFPHARSGRVDADSDEEKAPGARATLRKHLAAKLGNKQWQLPTRTPHVDPYGFEDPICDAFWKDVWLASAVHNVSTSMSLQMNLADWLAQTEIFRKVFHAIPDDLVTTWKQYKEFVVHHERLNKPVRAKSNHAYVAAHLTPN